ncbi:Uncharacterised protein [Vibrio cholerae]|nr:Uncharacterised protein [Vibrio cholerae]
MPSSPANIPTARNTNKIGIPNFEETGLSNTLMPINKAPIIKKLLIVTASTLPPSLRLTT